MLSQDSEDEFDQDLCLNLWHGLKKLLWQDELNPRVRCAFGNVLFIASFSVLSIAIHSDPDVPLWRKLLSITKKPFSPNPHIFIPVMKSVFLRNQRHIFRKWPLPKCNVTVILVNQNTCLPVFLQQQKHFVRHHSSVYSLTRSSKGGMPNWHCQ